MDDRNHLSIGHQMDKQDNLHEVKINCKIQPKKELDKSNGSDRPIKMIKPADPFATPLKILSEWYFFFCISNPPYCTNKLLGVQLIWFQYGSIGGNIFEEC